MKSKKENVKKYFKRHSSKRVASWVFSLVMVLSLLPVMPGREAKADSVYSTYVNTTTAVYLDGIDDAWYIIKDDSTASTPTVTLLAAQCVGASQFNDKDNASNTYEGSAVQTYLNTYYTRT